MASLQERFDLLEESLRQQNARQDARQDAYFARMEELNERNCKAIEQLAFAACEIANLIAERMPQ